MEPIPESEAPQQQIPLTSIEVTDDNVALNVMVTFLSIAQKRGAFSIDESAKLWECIKRFIPPQPVSDEPVSDEPVSDKIVSDEPASESSKED
jgi:hypothetical protein